MDARLERMRQLMREDEEKKTGGNRQSSGDKASYPYWDVPEKQTATIRFLPDKDEDNPWFWVERQTIKLPFEGVVGGERPTHSPVLVTVPCVDMFGDRCPIIAETQPWWKTNEARARKYWKKRSFITQGFVVSSPFEETDPPENPIRRLIVGPSLLEKLKAGLRDPEMENTPTDYLDGTDFKIKKTRKSDYNNYDTSEWSRRSRPLTEAEQIALQHYGLFNLADFKGARPDAEHIEMLKAMFHASVAGDPFDMASWGSHYKPWGNNSSVPDGVEDSTPAPKVTKPVVETVQADLVDDDGVQLRDAKNVLSKLRERTSAAARA